MTKTVVANGYGGPEVLVLREVSDTDPGPGEVAIEVRAIGVNPIDTMLYSGLLGDDPAALPVRIGGEVAGVVTAVGSGAVGFTGPLAPGDEVLAFRIPGGYAERIVVPAKDVGHKPASLSFEQAAGLLLVGATAVHALTSVGLQAGETVLIHGGAGAVGVAAAQLARKRGVKVIATASAKRHEQLQGYGVVPVEYGPGLLDRVRAIGPVDAALIFAGTEEALEVSLALVADQSRIGTIVPTPEAAKAGVRIINTAPGSGGEIRMTARPELVALAASGELEVVVDRTFPLAEAAEAHRYIKKGHAVGKIVLIP